MITQSINIFKEIKAEPALKCHYGFQLIAKKLVDQLKNEIESIECGESDPANIMNITQARSTISNMERMVEIDYEKFMTYKHIDIVIGLYNYHRPAGLKVNPDDYKAFANQFAHYQTCCILTKINPDESVGKYSYEYCKWVYDFIKEKVSSYTDTYQQFDDGYIWIIQELIRAIDMALPIFDTEDELEIDIYKKRDHMFSGCSGFEKYLKSLYRQYDMVSTFFPELMSAEWKSNHIIWRLDRKHRDMTSNEHCWHKAFIDSIIDPIMDDLKFLRDTHKFDQQSITKPTLQRHIDNLTNTIANQSKIKKIITVEIIEYLIILYEPILGIKYENTSF